MSTPANIQNFLKDANINVVQDNTPRRVVGVSVATALRPRPLRMNAFETPPGTPTRRAKSLSPVRMRLPDPKILESAKKASPVKRAVVPNPKQSSLVFSPLEYKMYNATSRPPSPVKVQVAAIARRKPQTIPVRVPGDYFLIKIENIQACDERFKCASDRKTIAQFTGEIVRGRDRSNFTMYIFNNGTVRITGGVPGNNPKTIAHVRNKILDEYTPLRRELYAPLKFSNLNAQFRFNGTFKPDVLKRVLLRHKLAFTYEPEIKQNFIKVSYKNHSFQLWFTGLVQLFGYRTKTQVEEAHRHGRALVKFLETEGATTLTGVYSSPIRKRKRSNAPRSPLPTLNQLNSMNMCKMSKKELLAYARLSGVTLPKHILKADICKKIRNSRSVKVSNAQVTEDLLNIFGKDWLRRYDWLAAHDMPKDIREVQKLISKLPESSRTKTKITEIERDYVTRAKTSRRKSYDSAQERLTRAVADLF